MTWQYLFLELPHTNKTRVKVANLNVDEVPQIGQILNELAADGWEVVNFSQSFTGAGAHFPPKFLLKREIKP